MQLCQRVQVRQPDIGHLRIVEAQISEARQPGQVDQSCIGYVRAVEFLPEYELQCAPIAL